MDCDETWHSCSTTEDNSSVQIPCWSAQVQGQTWRSKVKLELGHYALLVTTAAGGICSVSQTHLVFFFFLWGLTSQSRIFHLYLGVCADVSCECM